MDLPPADTATVVEILEENIFFKNYGTPRVACLFGAGSFISKY